MSPTIVSPADRIFCGRPPLGYLKQKGRWVVDPWAAERIKFIISGFHQGKRPVDVLNAVSTQYPRKRDGRYRRNWHYSELWSILRNARLYCFGEYQDTKCPDLAFVPEEHISAMSALRSPAQKA